MATQLREISALIIGGGSVGQVIGKHLALAGVNPALYLKPKYSGPADEGFYLYNAPTFGKRQKMRWDDFKIYTSPEQLSKIHADQVFVCVAESDLRKGWLEQIWPHFRHALWIFMQPGVDVYSYVSKIVPERFIVLGKPGFLAYQGPLDGEEYFPGGTVFWRPPGSLTLFKGINDETSVAAGALLQRGGLNVGLATDFEAARLYSTALFLPFIMSLESRGWSMQRLRDDDRAIARLCVAVNEVSSAIRNRTGVVSKLARRLQKPMWWRLLLKYGPRHAPIPIEAYYKQRGTRRRAEIELLLQEYAGFLTRNGVTPIALADIRKEWLQLRPKLTARSVDDTPVGMVVPNMAPPSVGFAQNKRVDDDGNIV